MIEAGASESLCPPLLRRWASDGIELQPLARGFDYRAVMIVVCSVAHTRELNCRVRSHSVHQIGSTSPRRASRLRYAGLFV